MAPGKWHEYEHTGRSGTSFAIETDILSLKSLVRLLSTIGRGGSDILELEFILTRVLVAYAIPGE